MRSEAGIINAPWWGNTGSHIRVAVIDSGIDTQQDRIPPHFKKGVSIIDGNLSDDFEDSVGHGTAVSAVLAKYVPSIELFMIKIFETDSDSTKQENLIDALTYVSQMEVKPHILHISNGVLVCDDKVMLQNLINCLIDQNVFIVSAFDNMGGISFPAAFPNVLGVDASEQLKSDEHYEYVENSIINIRGCLKKHRLPWKDNQQMIVEGASFTAPFFTAMAAKMLENKYSRADIYSNFKKYAENVIVLKGKRYCESTSFIKKAVIFPINKELHSLIEFNDLLPFDIAGIYDTKYLRNGTMKFINRLPNCKLKPQYLSELGYNQPFDTFILGHVRELEHAEKAHYFDEIMENCLKYKKNLVVFDDITDMDLFQLDFEAAGLHFYSPNQYLRDKPELQWGKLGITSKPVIGIFGTSSKQGKFSLQLRLRQQFLKKGYKVGQIGTEPQSELFGFDKVIPIGLHAPISFTPYEAVCAFNEAVMHTDSLGYDVIIAGSQSGSMPYETINLKYFTLYQNELLLASNFDVIILCINMNDEPDYIRRIITYLESLSNSTVLALAMFPVWKNISYLTKSVVYQACDETQIERARRSFEETIGVRCFILGLDDENLADCIEKFLTE